MTVPSDFVHAIFGIFNFKVSSATGSFGGICLAPLSHFEISAVKLAMPFGLLFCLAVLFAISNLFRAMCRRNNAEQEKDSLLSNSIENSKRTRRSLFIDTDDDVDVEVEVDDTVVDEDDLDDAGTDNVASFNGNSGQSLLNSSSSSTFSSTSAMVFGSSSGGRLRSSTAMASLGGSQSLEMSNRNKSSVERERASSLVFRPTLQNTIVSLVISFDFYICYVLLFINNFEPF